jgi:PAS domain S-box-containing protein
MLSSEFAEIALLGPIVEDVTDWVLLMDLNGRILWANRAWRDGLGYGSGDWELRDWRGFLEGPDPTVDSDLCAAAVARAKDSVQFTLRFVSKSGQPMAVDGQLAAKSIRPGREVLQALFRPHPAPIQCQPDCQKLASIAQHAESSVILTDEKGFIVWVNHGFTRSTGYSLTEAAGKKPGQLLQGPETDPATIARLRTSLHAGEGCLVDILNYRKDGSKYWSSIEIQPLFDDHHRLVNYMSIQRDITELRESDNALREQTILLEQKVAARTSDLEKTKRQFESLVEFAPDALFLSDPQGIIRLVNRRAECIFGWTREEMVGKAFETFVQDGLRQNRLQSNVHSGEVSSAPSPNRPINPGGLPLGLRKDGTRFPAEVSLGQLDSPEGRMLAAIVRDVTHVHKANSALREMEALYRRAISAANAVAYRLDHRSKQYLFIDQGIERLCGFAPEEITPELWNRISLKSIMLGEASGLTVQEALTLAHAGKLLHWRCDTLIRTKAGEDRWIAESSVEVQGADGRPMESIGILLDVTERKQAEEELRKFRAIADRATYGVAITSAEGILQYVNNAWAQFHGREPSELVGEHLSLFHNPSRMDRIRTLLQRIHEEGGFSAEEVWHQRRDGTEFLSLMSAVLIRASDGAPLYMAATCMDITESAQGRLRLRIQNEILEALAKSRPLIEVLELLCKLVESVHEQSVCTVMQLDERGILRLLAGPNVPASIRQLLDGVEPGSAAGSCANAAASGIPIFVSDTLTDPRWATSRSTAEATGIRSCWSIPIHDGERLFGTFAIGHLVRREADAHDRRLLTECARLAGIAVQRQHVQEELAESAAHFRALADSGTTLIWTSTADGACDYFNQPWLQFTGRTFQQELGHGWLTGVHPDDRSRISADIASNVGRRSPYSQRYRLQRHDGEYRFIEEHGTPRFNTKGEFIGFIGHCLDITERLAAERHMNRSQRLEAIGQLAGGIAHDLNNALAPILMTSSMMRLDYPGSCDLIDTVESSARRCADMVKQLLTFARGAEGERLLLQPKHLLSEMEKIIKGTFPKNIELRIVQTPHLWTVLGDATQLHQVLLNLCVNARDAMPNGGYLTIRAENLVADETFASTEPEAKPGRYIILEIADTGAGIPLELQDRIFEPFYTTKAPDKGTGLGLSTALGIIKGHGGLLRVYSEPGHGARFRILLPAAPDNALEFPLDQDQPDSTFTGKGLLVMVVDDEVNVRNAMGAVLSSMGFNVVLARDGTDALVCAAEKRYDLRMVITDLHMPQMGGIQFVRTLQRMVPEIPIIVASGRIDAKDEAELRSLGLQTLLSKPFTQETLTRALRQAFHGSGSSR